MVIPCVKMLWYTWLLITDNGHCGSFLMIMLEALQYLFFFICHFLHTLFCNTNQTQYTTESCVLSLLRLTVCINKLYIQKFLPRSMLFQKMLVCIPQMKNPFWWLYSFFYYLPIKSFTNCLYAFLLWNIWDK